MTNATATELELLSIGQHEAARITGVSAKTLGRYADRGEPVGRIKLNRRVLYHLPTLLAWLARKAEPAPAPGPNS